MSERSCWVAVASKDHVDFAVGGGFLQLNHGRAAPLERMRAGDCFVCYSPRAAHPGGVALQTFTAIGRIRTGIVYQATLADDLRPFRIDVDYLSARPAAIKPLIGELSFIGSKTYWGAAFRYGMRRVPAADFAVIAAAMGCSPEIAEVPEARAAATVG